MRADWEMEFVESGAQALARLEQAPFDVVVSDMRMPGMNGAELLNNVMVRFPKTVRLILSGHADREMIMKCVGSTHQFLAKPCEAEQLRATVARATALEGSLQSQKLMELVACIGMLPTLPSVYTEIVRCLQSPEVPLEEVGAIVAKDIGMTTKILKLVNSAFFGLGRQISSPGEATAYLGAENLKTLVISLDLFSQFEGARARGFSAESLCQHSLAVASAGKAIARCEKAPSNVVDESFVAGMLHDTGKLVLATNFPEEYSHVIERVRAGRLPMHEVERQVFGSSHAEVGGFLLGLWGLPVPVVEAISMHHAPVDNAARTFCALTATHAANSLVQGMDNPSPAAPPPPVDESYLKNLGLDGRLRVWQETVRDRCMAA